MKINRSANTYVELPDGIAKNGESGEAKAQISINLTIPKALNEKKMQKFLAEQTDSFSKAFKKMIKKQVEKLEDE